VSSIRVAKLDRFAFVKLDFSPKPLAGSLNGYTVGSVSSEPLVIGMASETPEQIELLELAQTGDEQACRELLLDVADRLERYITGKMPQKHQGSFSAEDVLQEVLFAIHRDLASFSPQSGASFYSWCYRIADNRLLDAIRRFERKKRGGDRKKVERVSEQSGAEFIDAVPGKATTPSVRVAKKERAVAVHEALEDLPENQREALKMRFIENRSQNSIAGRLAVSQAAVEGLLKRGKHKLAEMLAALSSRRR
jgi:RNA polymerase sigma-70 factor (ECF subfamily)